jgi:hypothetical protein
MPTQPRVKASLSAMNQDKSPVFRKAIIPWYDSTRTCWILIGFLLALILFGGAGVDAALGTPSFAGYVWVPLLLVILGLGVIGSILIRLLRRYLDSLSR